MFLSFIKCPKPANIQALVKASTKKTPQPSPAYHSAVAQLRSPHEFTATPERVAALRDICLARDRHRCVISRKFEQIVADYRLGKAGENARDDDGNYLTDDRDPFDKLDVAHILPHSLTQAGPDSQLVYLRLSTISFAHYNPP